MTIRQADKRLVCILFFSVLIHLLVALSILNLRHQSPHPAQPVTLIYQESPNRGGDGRKSERKLQKRRAIPLSALIPKMKIKIPKKEDWTKDPEDESPSHDGTALPAGGFQTREQIRFEASLWRMIDQYIEENPFLSEYNHTGNVGMRFEVDEAGNLVPGSLSSSAVDRVLKVIAARAIRKALKNETGDVQAPQKRTRIYAQFSWGSYQACETRRGYIGNQLSFCHYAENKRRSFSTAEKTTTWARAIANHGPWAYEDIQKYRREESRRRSQFNPFLKYEQDPDWNL